MPDGNETPNKIIAVAAVVQAISAAISAVLAGLIVKLTKRYVSLTERIAKAGEAQLAIAQLQAETAKDLKVATQQQQQMQTERSVETLAKDQARVNLAKRQLSAFAARMLVEFESFRDETPSVELVRLLPAISKEEIQTIREAAHSAEIESFNILEMVASALQFMADMKNRIEMNPGYYISSGEGNLYSAKLKILRAGLKELADYGQFPKQK